MSKTVLWLRIAYWWGIIVDAIAAILMLFPQLFVRFMNVDLEPDAGFSYGLRACLKNQDSDLRGLRLRILSANTVTKPAI